MQKNLKYLQVFGVTYFGFTVHDPRRNPINRNNRAFLDFPVLEEIIVDIGTPNPTNNARPNGSLDQFFPTTIKKITLMLQSGTTWTLRSLIEAKSSLPNWTDLTLEYFDDREGPGVGELRTALAEVGVSVSVSIRRR